ncbi:MAG: Phosphoenolpyruvate synthase family protein [Candidatus Daviesbacteria bacterium GW2011_GWA1_41_61]|uniref:Phosphoenolpyruvate synthase n=1 Tax=Candidatus Daviesbacteria bacterium GW2011_GWA2_40_9 TaxID=1618424 RepID=A0A0G0X4H1_9BACT|nr:MAG: Phosphoenolpyruvate synthase family protein [Candidatus Daviesbacteria bacterium GW2011_GWA2_40_9]KKR93134.1 MAG: Phosphoenolpyruvate synthase family protein [Candidatus Daviesbacteria bacterium GW2011_GWB1_41_15]KKS15678.1 MAG: Phosphoenolpyruvate synthase family protein [Candidatus Daviesbacteria bacterium GW2011_GWA1_41_61]
MYIKTFKQISKEDVAEVGGKGASLGEMTQAGIPVPPGFVVTAKTYRQFVNNELPVDVIEEILQAFNGLETERVAVRSSAIAEDSKTASWAGQLESYLNVTRADLIENIRKCWNSIRSERVLSYTAGQNLSEDQLVVAVVVQKMVESEVSGVMFTQNPVTKNDGEIMIEAGFGLGEYLVQGMITPDNFVADKNTLKIKSIDIQTQERMLIFKDGENKEVQLSNENGSKQALTYQQVQKLADLGKVIESHYGYPQDIEWALEKGNFYILQARPITA